MISIIVAVHNHLTINKIFLEHLQKYTYNPYELIVIDNNSTDGSREYFRDAGAIIVENCQNYSYPYCQNQGIREAKYDVLAFLNNDIIVAPHWDRKLMEAMDVHGLEIITPSGVEFAETTEATRKLHRRWKAIKNVVGLIAKNNFTFRLMVKLMYGDWEKYNQQRYAKYGTEIKEGFLGNSVIMKRSGLGKVGLWDERIQAADWDLYMRSKKRSQEQGDLKPVHVALGIFNHHFIRLTLKSKPPVFADAANIISLNEKWPTAEQEKLLKNLTA